MSRVTPLVPYIINSADCAVTEWYSKGVQYLNYTH